MAALSETYGFKKEFEYKGRQYHLQVVPFIIATDDDKRKFNLQEGHFLVHLFDGDSFKSFSVFYSDEQPVWESNVSTVLLDDKDLIERIGFLIDDYYA
jgi:hypothetical protein